MPLAPAGEDTSNVPDEGGTMNELLFQRIVETTSRFDALDLLSAVAALQLMPANVSRTVRLEVLAHAAATRDVDTDRTKASLENLRELCNEEPLASFEIVRNEDPPEWHFTEPLAWRGNSFVVFPGISDYRTFSFRHLAQAVDVPADSINTRPISSRRIASLPQYFV